MAFPDLRLVLVFAVCSVLLTSTQCSAKTNPFARSVQVDPGFGYYQDRSKESIASEVRANGYECVRMIVTRDSAADAGLVAACHKADMAVWYMTFANGVYSTGDLPRGWEKWRMRLRDRQPDEAAAGFTYLCLNNPEYRKWKRDQVVATLKRIPFDGFEMAEPFWPAYKGPESPLYGCLCDQCHADFLRMYPNERTIPSFTDPKSVNYYKTNTRLYKKWVEFRVRSVVSFQDYIVNGAGGVRRNCPDVKVAIWGIADDVADPVRTIRECEGIDGALVTQTVKPDAFVIQTDWPDWSNPKLPADYPLKYRPFVDAVRAVSKVPILMQADIGSWEKCRRGLDWIAKCEAAARKAGMQGIFSYEYHLSRDIYEAPPTPVRATLSGDTIVLEFNKRLDPAKARDIANYTVDKGRVISASPDGSMVWLAVEGRPESVTVRNLSDDPPRRFFKNHPAVTMPSEVTVGLQHK